MKTPEQNISTGFHRRGIALAYLHAKAFEVVADDDAFRRLFFAIRHQCAYLGIEPMDYETFKTWEGHAPGHED